MISQEEVFNTEKVIRSADVVRTTYSNEPNIYLYQGNGQFGSSYGPLGLHLHPSKKNPKYGKTQYMHLQHRGRAKFNSDYLIPMLEIYWEKPFNSVSHYSQQQSYYDGVISTSFKSENNAVKVETWFDPVKQNLSFISINSSKAGSTIIVDPCNALTIHYEQHVNQAVSIQKKEKYWEISLECFGKKSLLYLYTNAIVTAKDNVLTLTLKKGDNYINVSYDTPSSTSVKTSLTQTKDWWHEKWNNSGCIKITEDKAQKTWVRSMAMFLSSYSDADKGLAPPMGFTGNWWPFYYPQDVSYVHPILLSTGNINIAKSWIEHWSERVDGLRKYTKRLYGIDGILAPWVFPYGDFEGYHNPGPPNKFYCEIHNSGYFAKMANETAVYVNDPEWTKKYAIPLLEGCAEFYRNICTKEDDGLWHLYVKPSMGQDERGGENQKDYLCALYSAKYCFQQAIKYGLDQNGLYTRILNDGLAFESLKSPGGFYYSSAGSGESDFGKQKHPVQLNELAFLPVEKKVSPSAQIIYDLRYDITRDAKVPYFYGWTLGEFLLSGSRIGNTEQWLKDWDNMEKSTYVDPEWIQIYETSKDLSTPFYNVTNGLVAQSLLNNLVSDWYGTLEIAKCNPWKGKVSVKNIHSLLGVIVDGEIDGKSYVVTLRAWKDTEFKLSGETIKLKLGEKTVKSFKSNI